MTWKTTYIPAFLCWFVLILFFNIPALAHRVDVFCWVEDNKVLCESKFSDGTAVNKGRYEVRMAGNDQILVQGTSDKFGKFSFDIPRQAILKKTDLKVTIIASMGHKNSWTVQRDEFISKGTPESVQSPEKTCQMPGSSNNDSQLQTNSDKNTGPALSAWTEKKLRSIVHQELIRELGPIKRELAELKEPKIDPRDVLGGIGYIIGLFGLICLLKNKN